MSRSSPLRTRIRADNLGPDVGTYPDIAIVCGPVIRDSDDPIAIVNPKVVIEVLSNSTEAYERHRKFEHYNRLESLEDYVLVAQHQARIERFAKHGGVWLPGETARLGEKLTLASIGITLTVSAIYEGLVREDGRIRVA